MENYIHTPQELALLVKGQEVRDQLNSLITDCELIGDDIAKDALRTAVKSLDIDLSVAKDAYREYFDKAAVFTQSYKRQMEGCITGVSQFFGENVLLTLQCGEVEYHIPMNLLELVEVQTLEEMENRYHDHLADQQFEKTGE